MLLYKDGEIDFAGNNRYYIMDEDKKTPNDESSSSTKNTKEDIQSELRNYKKLLDEGLIDESDYNSKKKELLGL